MVDLKEQKIKIHQDPDWINLKRYNNSLEVLLAKFGNGVPDNIICNALMIDEEILEEIYNGIVTKLRTILKVKS